MIVQHNITAMNANRMLGITTSAQAKSTEKLSSGYKINRAADDAAGLAISEKMRRQARGLTQAAANAQDGISAVQTAEGALTEVHDMLQRMNELAIKAGNGTMSESDRQSVQDEIDQLITEIDRVSETTKFNETYLLKGSGDKSATVKAEANVGGITQEATVIAAKGNIFSGKIKAEDALASGTEDTATVTYKDADGNTRTKDVVFKAGASAKDTAANIAEAINDDKDLKAIFKAYADETGKLTVESKLSGNKTDNSKNSVTDIEFKAKDGKLTTAFDGDTTKTPAVGESVKISLTDKDGTMKLTSGNSITIDGKTYTYDKDKASTTDDANTFKSIEDLQNLLGNNYEVTVNVDSKVTYKTVHHNSSDGTGAITDANGGPVSTENKIESDGTLKAASKATEIESLALTDFDGVPEADAAAPNNVAASAGDAVTYKSAVSMAGLSLNIARKATVDMSDALHFSLQVGADTTEENKINVDIESMSAKSLGIDNVSVTGKDSTNADEAVNTVADAIAKVSKQRSALGAIQNRLEHTINNLNNVVENTTSAEAAIRDTDIATEMVKYANNNILQQAGTSMLAQANQSNQLALSLLG
ncbi:MAG: flagellar hook protein [Clostridiales bacterium]|nr:flagellar hook protein [Clostridiales bacterium]